MRANDTRLFPRGVAMSHEAPLTAAERAHTERLHAHLCSTIAAEGGWINFERYMDLALYTPGLGYYSAGGHKIGRAGDFITAPETSALFGACIAKQCAEILCSLPGGSIVEIGAGTGRLAVDVLSRLDTLDCLPDHYVILDVSADLRDRQRRLLGELEPRLSARVTWIDSPPATPIDGVILANEVLDALPVARFRWHPGYCEELGVVVTGADFAWHAQPASAPFTAICRRLQAAASCGWDDGYVSEFCPRLPAWAGLIARSLRRGAVLWFDYGLPRPQYYLAERHEGTLLCHFRQRPLQNPFVNPGLQDITAWVDFTAVAEAGVAAGCDVTGFCTQAFFLAGLAIDREMNDLAGGDQTRFAQLANQARRLMMPGEMGESFKAMAWTRGIEGELSGFTLQDLRHTL